MPYEDEDPAWRAVGAMNAKDAELTTLRQRAEAAEWRVAELEALAKVHAWARATIRQRWSFDNNQQHTHSWNDREDFCAEWNRRHDEALRPDRQAKESA